MTAKKIIRQIAREQGVTPKEVEADMKEAIRAAMSSTDPVAQEVWKQLAPDGKEPTIEEFLKFCATRVHTQINSSNPCKAIY